MAAGLRVFSDLPHTTYILCPEQIGFCECALLTVNLLLLVKYRSDDTFSFQLHINLRTLQRWFCNGKGCDAPQFIYCEFTRKVNKGGHMIQYENDLDFADSYSTSFPLAFITVFHAFYGSM